MNRGDPHRRPRRWGDWLAMAAMAWLAAPAGAAPVTFSDSTLNAADWAGVKVLDLGIEANSFAAEQAAGGGNPGSFLRVTLAVGRGDPRLGHGLDVAFLRRGATYEPRRQGPITALDVSFDIVFLGSQSPDDPFPPHGACYFPALLQNGVYYFYVDASTRCALEPGVWGPRQASAASGWSRHGAAGPLFPDFSASGAPIQFGFLTGVGWGDPDRFDLTSGIDNWRVTIHGGGGQGGADLTGSGQLALTCPPAGRRCRVKATLTVRNVGTESAVPSTVRFFVSNDAVLDAGDVQLPNPLFLAVPRLRPGAARTVQRTFRVAADVAAQFRGRFVIALIDADQQVAETNESNNTVVAGPIP